MRICNVSIKGVTPYSQSKIVDPEVFPKKEKEGPDEYDKRLWKRNPLPTKQPQNRMPKEKSTFDAKGEVCIPAMALKMSVDEAVKRLNIGISGRGKSTYTKFFVAGQICEGDVPIGVSRDDLEQITIWANSDGVRGSGKRVKRRFPYIAEWMGVARFAILDEVIPNDVFEKAVTEAGRLIGIGRFRPEKGGFLGRFAVTGFADQDRSARPARGAGGRGRDRPRPQGHPGMTTEVHASDVAVFTNGRKVVSVTRPGSRKVPTKAGLVDQPFNVGDVMLVDAGGHAIVAPLNFAGASEIARAVIEGDPHAVTDSHSLRALATAVIGFAAQVVAPEPASDAIEERT